jgi:SAM-dependent methyltransferase
MIASYTKDDTTQMYSDLKERFARHVHTKVLPELRPNSTIVEFGPGAGEFARECRRLGHRYIGLEGSRVFAAARSSEGTPVVRALLPSVPLADASADVVYSSMVLEHMSSPGEATRFVEEAARVVRPGGTVVLMFPNAYANGPIFWEMDYTHGYFTTPRRVQHMCEHLGLEVVAVHRSLQWFWVRPTPLHSCARLLSNFFTSILNWPPVVGVAEAIGLGDLAYRVRKTFFESSIVVARRANPSPPCPDHS